MSIDHDAIIQDVIQLSRDYFFYTYQPRLPNKEGYTTDEQAIDRMAAKLIKLYPDLPIQKLLRKYVRFSLNYALTHNYRIETLAYLINDDCISRFVRAMEKQ